MKTSLKKQAWFVIARRELSAYFTSPIAYIVSALFLIFSGFLFFSTFFLNKRAELRYFFELLPTLFSFFIPALTMRVFSEEKRSGTIETLVTLPIKTSSIVAGKYIASVISSVALLIPTLFYVIMCYSFGSPDKGPIIGGYLGAVLLVAAFTAIGIFASSITKNQIIAFFVSFTICFALSMLSDFAVIISSAFVPFVTFISAKSHFASISRGIVDIRDVLYFASVIVVFVALTVGKIQDARRG